MNQSPVRVLVVDDSAVVRGLLARAIERDPGLQVVGTAMHGEAALAALTRSPADVVVLDVEMPVMDGLTALKAIQERFPQVRVIMASALTSEGAETTCRALALGAAGCFAKPQMSSMAASIDHLSAELLPMIRALGARTRRLYAAKKSPSEPIVLAPNRPRTPPQAIVIGASTGGPQALRALLCSLPTDFPLPIFVVQHMPPLFTPMLAKHLALDTGRPCQEATHQELVQPGHTYIAPGGFHLELERTLHGIRTRITEGPPEHFCRPSVNPLFRTASRCYGGALQAIMLTGMGEDGLSGSRTLVDAGGHLVAQNEATSVVWGMPGAVVKAGLAHEVLPLEEIGSWLLTHCPSLMVTT